MQTQYIEDDSALVESCINGDNDAWTTLANKYSTLILKSISNRLKKCGLDEFCGEAEDIRQGILSSIWNDQKLQAVKNRKRIACWLAIVSGNAALTYARKKMSGKNIVSERLSEEDYEKIPLLSDLFYEIESETVRNDNLAEIVKNSIDSLPAKERLAIQLNLMHNMKYAEISDILHMPQGTVSCYIKRAKDKLRKKLNYLQQFDSF